MSGWARRIEAALCAGALAAALCGCAAKPVVATSTFPEPVLRKIPANVGLYVDPAFSSYVYHDRPENGPFQDVSVGPASAALFRSFLGAQFATLVPLDRKPPDGTPSGIEAVLLPEIEAVQIAAPKAKTDQFYEAWIRYRLHLLSPQGVELTSWELAAYGKHRGTTMGGANPAWTAAVEDAMRDAAAGMALVFRDPAGFRAILAAPPPSAPPAGPAS